MDGMAAPREDMRWEETVGSRAGGLPTIDVNEGTLRASGVLGLEEEDRFESALKRLAESEARRLVIDLSEADYVSSSYVRHMAEVMVEAKKSGRSVVVRAKGQVARILGLAGLEKLSEFEVVG